MIVDQNLPPKIETKLGGEYNVESVINDDGTQTLNINYVGSAYENKLSNLVSGVPTEISAKDLEGATYISTYAFYYQSALVSIELPDTVLSIKDYAFQGSGIVNITIPDSVTSIGRSAFQYCKSLIEIIIPNSVLTVSDQAFYECTNLENVVLPSALNTLSRSLFASCTKLTNVFIPSNVNTINDYVFNNCSKLTEITIEATTPPTLAYTRAISTATTTIYIPVGTLEAYSTATNWSSFADKFVEKEM